MILGKYQENPQSKFSNLSLLLEAWLFDIVANKRNSIDVDKFDYIQRDTRMLGTPKAAFDPTLLLKGSRVVNDEICYPAGTPYQVYALF